MQNFIYGGNTGRAGPDAIKNQQRIAAALAQQALTTPRDLGSGIASIGQALLARRMMGKAAEQETAGRDEAAKAFAALFGGGGAGGTGEFAPQPQQAPLPPNANTQIVPMQGGGADPRKALLDAIAGPESAGQYDVMYGGGKFDDFSQHPAQRNPITTGPNAGNVSTAAGRYQFLQPTWDEYQQKLGLPDFSPESQDAAAIALASDRYKAATGRDLQADLAAGRVEDIAPALNGTWTSLPGGIEQGAGAGDFTAKLAQALAAGQPQQQPVQQPSPQPQQQPRQQGPDIGQLTQALDNPYLTDGQRAVVSALLQKQMAGPEQSRAVSVGGRLVDPRTGQVVYESPVDPMGAERARIDLDLKRQQLEDARRPQPPKPPEVREFPTADGGKELRQWNPATGAWETVSATAPGPDRAPGAVREYEFYAGQERDSGRTPVSFAEWKQANAKAGAASVNVNTGESGALRKKLDEATGTQWAGYLASAGQAAGTVADMDALEQLVMVAPQGPITGRLAEAFPGFDSAASAWQSIVKRLAPTLREPGSGSTSDIEYNGMLQALPSLVNAPAANQAILTMMREKQRIMVERGQIVSDFQGGRFSEQEARGRIADLNKRSIMTPEISAALRGIGVTIGGDAGAPTSAGPPEGVDPEVWQYMSPEDRALWLN